MADSTLYHEERGEGTPVVLVHGFPFDHSIWQAQLKALGREARALAPDLPGFGRSKPLSAKEPTMDDYAERIARWAGDSGLDRFVLVGHSMGGYIAFALARLYPERLLGLGLVCTRPGPDSEEGRRNRYKMIDAVEEKGAQATVDAMLSKLFGKRTQEEKPKVVEQTRRLMLAQSSEGIVAALKAMASRPDSTPLLAGIRVPTLVISGAEDSIIPAQDADLMASTIPGARKESIGDAAHMPMLEQPDELSALLRSLARDPELEA
jgi:3-oxoadipate enol-lactonase